MRKGSARSQDRGDGKVLNLTVVVDAGVQWRGGQDEGVAVDRPMELKALGEDLQVALEVAHGVGIGRGIEGDVGDQPGISRVARKAEA